MRRWSSSSLSFWAWPSFFFSPSQRWLSDLALLLELDDRLVEPGEPLLGGRVGFLAQGLALDLHLHEIAIDGVELFGLGVDLHLQARSRLVDEIDGLVGQKAIGDVAVREGRRSDQRAVGDAHAVVQLVLLLQAAQDRDGVLDRRLGDEDRLEAPRQRSVLLDVLAILVERGGADAVQLAARQRGLQQIAGIHGALGLAGADDGVQLVDEQDDAAALGLNLGEHGLQPLLELAAILGAGDQGAHVERQQLLVLEALGHVALDDALGQTLGDGGLADAGIADQHGIVLGAPRQHLDGAADLLVAADHRVHLALGSGGGEIAGVALEGIIGLLGRSAVGGAALADVVDGLVQRGRIDARLVEGAARVARRLHGQRQQQALDRDELVAGLVGNLLGGVEHPRQLGRKINLPGTAARNLGPLGQRPLDRAQRVGRPAAGALDQACRQPLRVVEQDLQQMIGAELLVTFPQSQALRSLHESLRAVGILVEIHLSLLGTATRPVEARNQPSSDRITTRGLAANPSFGVHEQ